MSTTTEPAKLKENSRDINDLDLKKIPKHIAIIMDGNRRWAKSQELPSISGHWRGAEALIEICSIAGDLGVKTLTVYSFSIENWDRSDEEVEALFELVKTYCISQKPRMLKQGLRLRHIGNIEGIPQDCRDVFLQTQEDTKHGKTLDLVLALNYGARDEIKRAFLAMVDDVEKGKLEKSKICPNTISRYLDTKDFPDPEMIIRTSGEMRLSNFLLYQASYSELIISKKMWPEFTPNDFVEALVEYQNRDKRFGK